MDSRQGKETTWNFSIQHALGSDFLITATYIGRHDDHLPVPIQLSPGVLLAPNLAELYITAI